MAYSTRGLWSVRSLASHLLGETSQSRNALADAPERMLDIVAEGLRELWELEDWFFQRRVETLSVSAADEEEALPADFRKLDSRWLQDNEQSSTGLVFTHNVAVWEEVWSRYGDNDDGEPRIACVMQDTSELNYDKWKALLAPKADQAYSYEYIYLPICPIDLDSDATLHRGDGEIITMMPKKFHAGWRMRGRWKVLQVFGDPDDAKDAKKDFDTWHNEALKENNARLVDPTGPVHDGYGDWASLQAQGYDPDIRRIRGRVGT